MRVVIQLLPSYSNEMSEQRGKIGQDFQSYKVFVDFIDAMLYRIHMPTRAEAGTRHIFHILVAMLFSSREKDDGVRGEEIGREYFLFPPSPSPYQFRPVSNAIASSMKFTHTEG